MGAAVSACCSEKLLNDVYTYWAAKRKKWGKPILRRLQAPTIASDTNPYNTFRCVLHHHQLSLSLEARAPLHIILARSDCLI